jgi:hypothetical protein
MDCEGKKRALYIQGRVEMRASSAIGVKWLE